MHALIKTNPSYVGYSSTYFVLSLLVLRSHKQSRKNALLVTYTRNRKHVHVSQDTLTNLQTVHVRTTISNSKSTSSSKVQRSIHVPPYCEFPNIPYEKMMKITWLYFQVQKELKSDIQNIVKLLRKWDTEWKKLRFQGVIELIFYCITLINRY